MKRLLVLVGCALVWAQPAVAAQPDVPDDFTAAQREALVEAAGSGRVLLEFPRELPGWSHGSPAAMADRIDAETAGSVPVVVWAGADHLPAYGVSRGTTNAACASTAVEKQDVPAEEAFVALATVIAEDRGCEAMDAELAKVWEELGEDIDDIGTERGTRQAQPPSTGTKVLRGIALAVLALLGGGLVIAVWRRMRAARSERRRTAAISGHVTGADVVKAREDAQAALLDLGDALDHAEMRDGDALSFWALALDEYEQATRIADADDRGMRQDLRIQQLCEDGRRHLSEATRGRV